MADGDLHVALKFGGDDIGGRWSVASASGTESLGSLYTVRVSLTTDFPSNQGADMRGKSAWLKIQRGRKSRFIHGIVASVTPGRLERGMRTATIHLVPALALLEHSSHSRIFADKSVPDIAKSVLEEALRPFGRSVQLNLDDTAFAKREYVVQHQETDLQFVLRLLADEGIWLDFHQPDDPQKNEGIVLSNSNRLAPAIAESSSVSVVPERELNTHHEAITSFAPTHVVLPTAIKVRQHNWTHPEVPQNAQHRIDDPAGLALLVREYGGVHPLDYDEKQHRKFDTKHQAKVRLEAIRSQQELHTGRSNAILLRPGYKVEVGGRSHLLTSLNWAAETTSSSDAAGHSAAYAATFQCIPLDVPYRPRRSDKPRVAGHEFATVVSDTGSSRAPMSGSSGGDIAVDPHNHMRVRVKFDWDETEAGQGGTTSCWVHSLQSWAGSLWGAQFIPRVGMRVAVSFEGGDPDRPVIVGCAYNGLNPPPYKKPTQSGIKSSSSVDPSRYNELRFEDANGAEEVFLRAQSKHTIQVGTDRTETVGGNHSETVAKDKTITVSGKHAETVSGTYETTIQQAEMRVVAADQTLQVGGNQTESIGGNRSRTVAGMQSVNIALAAEENVGAIKTVTVAGALKELVGLRQSRAKGSWSASAGSSIELEAKANIVLKALKDFAVEAGESLAIKAKKWMVEVAEDVGVKGGTKGVIEFADELQIKVGSASITLKKNGDIAMKGAKITIQGSDDVIVKGSKLKAN